MTTIVVPFRGNGKRRLAAFPDDVRAALAMAMVGDVLEACTRLGKTVLVTADEQARDAAPELGVETVADGAAGQGPAVAAALRALAPQPTLIVNADLPAVTPPDLRLLLGALPPGGLALVPGRDGTTNALALAEPRLFAPRYGPKSAERFRLRAAELGVEAVTADVANLADDVDTPADLHRVAPRVGRRTRAVLDAVGREAA